jgi:hypothetical protein
MSATNPVVPPPADPRPLLEETSPETSSVVVRLSQWMLDESPAWLGSFALHLLLLLVIAIFFGQSIVKGIVGDAPAFTATSAEAGLETEPERFEVAGAPIDPSELTTESLTMNDPPGQLKQDAVYYDENPEFQERGGGSPTAPENGAGGLGFDIKADGLGPLLSGEGGADPARGEGVGFGKGGPGQGFGSRGQGHRDALVGRYGGTKQTERAVAGALSWLARHQNVNGSWGIRRYTGRCRDRTCTGPGSADAESGGTALGLLPFLGAGQTHQSPGPYQKNISKAIRWLMAIQKPNGDLSGGGNSHHQMYQHGLATIALCEAYGMTQDSRVGMAAQAAVKFIESGQNEQGSWRYTHGTNSSDTSVFGWQMMALKSAMMAGLAVDANKMQLGRDWLQKVADPSLGSSSLGRFSYVPGGQPTPCMSSVGLLIKQYTGSRANDPELLGGMQYLMANLPDEDQRNMYYWYYAAQVMHHMGGQDWDKWNRRMRRILVESQAEKGCATGSWDPAGDAWGSGGGRLMVTSLAALTLEVYYRYLPLYKVDEQVTGHARKEAVRPDAPKE